MSTLKVNGLTYRTVEREVEKLFEKYGKINEVFIPKDRYSRRSRGFAFVRFVDKLDAESAKSDVDRRIFDGRELRIEWSKKDATGERRRSGTRSRSRNREPKIREGSEELSEKRGHSEERPERRDRRDGPEDEQSSIKRERRRSRDIESPRRKH